MHSAIFRVNNFSEPVNFFNDIDAVYAAPANHTLRWSYSSLCTIVSRFWLLCMSFLRWLIKLEQSFLFGLWHEVVVWAPLFLKSIFKRFFPFQELSLLLLLPQLFDLSLAWCVTAHWAPWWTVKSRSPRTTHYALHRASKQSHHFTAGARFKNSWCFGVWARYCLSC